MLYSILTDGETVAEFSRGYRSDMDHCNNLPVLQGMNGVDGRPDSIRDPLFLDKGRY